MKPTRRRLLVVLPVAAVALLALGSAYAASRLPSPMATHFDASGQPDGQLPRTVALAVPVLLATASVVGLLLVPRASRRVRNPTALAVAAYALVGASYGLQLCLYASNAGLERPDQARLSGTGWLALVVPFAALGLAAGLAARRQPPPDPGQAHSSARVTVDRDQVVVELRGLDAWLALRRRVSFPRSCVVAADVVDGGTLRPAGLRLPGTSVPGVVTAGSYGTGPRREFWSVRGGGQVLVLTLGSEAAYRRVVLEPADPEAARQALSPATS